MVFSTNTTFLFVSDHDCMNRGSTVGKNMNYIMWKFEVSRYDGYRPQSVFVLACIRL